MFLRSFGTKLEVHGSNLYSETLGFWLFLCYREFSFTQTHAGEKGNFELKKSFNMGEVDWGSLRKDNEENI
jgi:hypothetical protein